MFTIVRGMYAGDWITKGWKERHRFWRAKTGLSTSMWCFPGRISGGFLQRGKLYRAPPEVLSQLKGESTIFSSQNETHSSLVGFFPALQIPWWIAARPVSNVAAQMFP